MAEAFGHRTYHGQLETRAESGSPRRFAAHLEGSRSRRCRRGPAPTPRCSRLLLWLVCRPPKDADHGRLIGCVAAECSGAGKLLVVRIVRGDVRGYNRAHRTRAPHTESESMHPMTSDTHERQRGPGCDHTDLRHGRRGKIGTRWAFRVGVLGLSVLALAACGSGGTASVASSLSQTASSRAEGTTASTSSSTPTATQGSAPTATQAKTETQPSQTQTAAAAAQTKSATTAAAPTTPTTTSTAPPQTKTVTQTNTVTPPPKTTTVTTPTQTNTVVKTETVTTPTTTTTTSTSHAPAAAAVGAAAAAKKEPSSESSGLPGWAWALIGAGVVGGAIWIITLIRRGRKDSSPSDATGGPGASGDEPPPPDEPPRA